MLNNLKNLAMKKRSIKLKFPYFSQFTLLFQIDYFSPFFKIPFISYIGLNSSSSFIKSFEIIFSFNNNNLFLKLYFKELKEFYEKWTHKTFPLK